MAHLIRMPRAAWRQMPTTPMIDFSCPLVNELTGAWLMNGSVDNLINPSLKMTHYGSPQYEATSFGVAGSYSGAPTRYSTIPSNAIFDNGGLWTFFIQSNGGWDTGGGSTANLAFLLGRVANTSNYGFYVLLSPSGTFSLQCKKASVAVFNTAGTINVLDNKPHFVAVSIDNTSGGQCSVYVDGKLDIVGNTSDSFSFESSPVSIADNGDSWWEEYKGAFGNLLFYRWGKSEAYIKALSENPYQIFTPRPARFILIPSSGGGTSSIYQDGLIRWHILQEIQNDASLTWDVKVSLQNDLLTRWNVLTGVLSDTTLRWHSLAAIQQDTLLRWDVASALFAVQQDATLRWNMLSAVQQEVIARWNSLASLEQDVVARWNLLSTIEQDTILRWHTLTAVQQDHLLRWNALQSLSQDQALRWDVLSEILSAQNDVVVRWDSLSAVQQDALLRWNLATQIEQSLAVRWNLLNAIEVDAALRWDIAVAVANEILLRWDLTESLTASNDLSLTWDLLAVAENQIELRWNLGDNSLTPGIRVFLVRGEDRTFRVVSEDRTFGVQ
jgi:hypothetical protein